MKLKNSIISLNHILYKIYEDCILISTELRNRDVRVEGIELIINDWLNTLKKINFRKKEVEKIKLAIINEINLLKEKREINVYTIWDIQNKIDSLKICYLNKNW